MTTCHKKELLVFIMAAGELFHGYNNVINGTPSPLPRPYLPSLPPRKNSKPSYSRFLVSAPISALSDVVADAREPPKPPQVQRCQKRVQVGSTNRWRIPHQLGSDLLGSAQAIKAASSSYNDTYIALRTADSPMTTCNHPEVNGSTVRNCPGGPLRSLLSPRFLKSQPAASVPHFNTSRRWIQTQPSYMHLKTKTPDRTSFKGEMVDSPTPGQLMQINYQRNIIPANMRSPTPMEMLLYKSQTVNRFKTPDVVIHALDHVWEMHKPYLQKSSLLCSLIKKAEKEGLNDIDEEEEKEATHKLAGAGPMDLNALKTAANSVSKRASGTTVNLPHASNLPLYPKIMRFKLRIKDPLITKQAFAYALSMLYENECDITVEEADVVGVLAAANFLGFVALEKVCINMMLGSVAAWSVCAYHAAAKKYRQNSIMELCERWLEVNLVPQLLVQIYLSHLPQDLLERTLKSTRLFTWNEYSLYKLLAYWVFLQKHSTLQIMPSWGTVVTWFMSFPKTVSFLEQEEGQRYISLFRTIRLEGITESSQLDEIQKMNIVPNSWLLAVYSQHYHALQGGGDMSLMTRFEQGAIRHGFVIEQKFRFHSEIVSLHGFHFEVRVTAEESGYSFGLQRLRPNDPILSFKASERHTFSMRSEREVRYSFRIQWVSGETYKLFNTGVQSQSFCFSGKNKRGEPTDESQKMKQLSTIEVAGLIRALSVTLVHRQINFNACYVDDAVLPMFITVSLMFPPS